MTPAPAYTILAGACIGAAVLAACAIIVIFDLRERRIPNAAVCALSICALAYMVLEIAMPGQLPVLCTDEPIVRLAWCLGSLFAMGGAECVWRATHDSEHGMGMGDIKLIGAMALWVGGDVVWCLGAACMLACAAALASGSRTFAFGPYLVAALLAALLL